MAVAVTTLIVDDSADSRNWLKSKILAIGCQVVGEAECAAQGWQRFEALHPRLVTLDIMMPETDGMTAMDLLSRISREDSDAAVLVVSSRPVRDSHAFLKLGAIGYLAKPFVRFDEVAELLRACFPELDDESAALRKKHGLSSRLGYRS